MRQYQESDLLRLAKRHHNTKRTYLLVDPLQGKHMPVSPSAALQMLETLGEAVREAEPRADVVVGFAETATAVGAAVARSIGADCYYIHTTREDFALTDTAVPFREEHSHAADQWLNMQQLIQPLLQARAVVFVDDEISTGKTLLNIISALRKAYPALEKKPMLAASIINRLEKDRLDAFAAQGVRCCSLLHLPLTDYSAAVAHYEITGA